MGIKLTPTAVVAMFVAGFALILLMGDRNRVKFSANIKELVYTLK